MKSTSGRNLAIFASALLLSFNANASHYAAVNKDHCVRMQHTTKPFILVLNRGENIHESINQCASDAKIKAASLSGLGQLENPTLAYFTSNPQEKPTLKKFEGFYELASFNGNITNNANKYYTHAHVGLADNAFHGINGHLNSATVGLTAEITIIPILGSVERVVDPKTGFGQIITR